MKFNGKPIVRETRKVTIPRSNKEEEVVLTVSSITVGVKRDFEVLWPRPRVPKLVTQGKSGREEKEDWSDPKFLAEMEERTSLQNIYIMYRVLENDPNIAFDHKPTTVADLRALAEEVKQSGLSEGDVVVILKEALLASNLTQEEIDKVKGDF
jgi:hypothetical protein